MGTVYPKGPEMESQYSKKITKITYLALFEAEIRVILRR
jgi:hypothetical protein